MIYRVLPPCLLTQISHCQKIKRVIFYNSCLSDVTNDMLVNISIFAIKKAHIKFAYVSMKILLSVGNHLDTLGLLA